MKKSIKSIIIFTVILAVAIALIQVTVAILTAESSVKANAFVPGVLSIATYENGTLTPQGEKEITPAGDTAQKTVQFKNVNDPHEVDCYIRAMLVPSFRTDEGTLAGNVSLTPIGNNILITAPDGGTVTLHLKNGWNDQWVFNGGFFYYKSIVHPGEMTDALLNSVTVSDTDLWSTFHLEVLSDAVQAEYGAASDAWGAAAASLLE